MADDDPKYLDWVREQRCNVCGRNPPSHPHHVTGAGMGTRSPDRQTIPLCPEHHRQFHDVSGHFKGWPKERRRSWQLTTADLYRLQYEDPSVF
jgi:hypothetical protein